MTVSSRSFRCKVVGYFAAVVVAQRSGDSEELAAPANEACSVG